MTIKKTPPTSASGFPYIPAVPGDWSPAPSKVADALDQLAATGGGGAGDVVGPASATDNALTRFDGVTGKLVQDSNATLSDAGDLVVTGIIGASNLSGANTGDQDLTSLVVGPASATDNAVTRYDGVTGKLIQDSNATISDAGDLAVTGTVTGSNLSGSNTGDQDLSTYVVGPGASTDNALARFDSTTGKLIQDSTATLSDAGDLAIADGTANITKTVTDSGTIAAILTGVSNTTVDGSNATFGLNAVATGTVAVGAINDKSVSATNTVSTRGDGTDDGNLSSLGGTTALIFHNSGAAGTTDLTFGHLSILFTQQGTITDHYDLRAQRVPGAGVVTNHYGVYIPHDNDTPVKSWLADANRIGGNAYVAPVEALEVAGNAIVSGTISASNLSGTNTGDQNLSTYVYSFDTNTTQTANVAPTESDLLTKSIAANTLNVDGNSFKYLAFGTFAANANVKQLRAYFGGTVIFDTGAVVFNDEDWRVEIDIIRTGAATQKCIAHFVTSSNLIAPMVVYTNATEDLTTILALDCTGEAAGNGDIVQEGHKIKFEP